jgi:hypothetical protein
MDNSKLALGSIIGVLLASGALAYAYELNIKATFDDKAVTDYNTAATAANKPTFDKVATDGAQSTGNKILFGDKIGTEGRTLMNTANKVWQTQDLKTIEAGQKCLDDVLAGAATLGG